MKKFILTLIIACSIQAQKQKIWTIDEIVEYAIKNSYDIKKTNLALVNQVERSAIARSFYDLNLSLKSDSSTDGDTQKHSFGLTQPLPAGFEAKLNGTHSTSINDNHDSNMSVEISKQILGGGNLNTSLKEIRNSHTDELIKLNDLKKEKRSLVRNIMIKFYSLIKAKKSLEISKRRLETSKKNLEMTIAREDPLDISNAKIEIPQNELGIIKEEFRVKTQLDDLQTLMGLTARDKFVVNTEFEFSLAKPNAKEDIEYAENNSEDFINNKLTRIKLVREMKDRNERKLPEIDLYLKQDLSNNNENTSDDTTLGINLSWKVGSRAEVAQYNIAKNELYENELNYKILYNEKLQTLRSQERGLKELDTSIKIQEQEIKFNEEQAELYKDRWESGKMAILEYIRSQNRLEQARIGLVNLKSDYMTTLQNYLFETGMSYAPNLTLVKKEEVLTDLSEITIFK